MTLGHLLRDGSRVDDPRLDRLREFDEASRDYPIRALIDTRRPRSRTWNIPATYVIDQGGEGACVGFAITNELQARPAPVVWAAERYAAQYARETIYWGAQAIDPWPGGAYPGASPRYEGTSVLAGLKVAVREKWFRQYRWAFGIDDLLLGLHRGPALLGINWHESMYRPDPTYNLIRPYGPVVGGHAILARASQIEWSGGAGHVDYRQTRLVLRNSWGSRWGNWGDAFITAEDLALLLSNGGEAAFAIGRRTQRT